MQNQKTFVLRKISDAYQALVTDRDIDAAIGHLGEALDSGMDTVDIIRCKDCIYNRCCMLQSFVKDNSGESSPFDEATWYCPDGTKINKEEV